MFIKIDKNIPMPKGKDFYPFPFSGMEVGDSFGVPMNHPRLTSLRSYRQRAAKTFGMQFESHCVYENGESVMRVWRVE